MPFYVSPEQQMRDKSDYARKGVGRSRSSVVLQYAGGILLATPNASTVLHKISEIYDRIAFAAVGRYNEYEVLRKAGVTYADLTGYSFDRGDVTARGLANWYAQQLGTSFTESMKPYEVEIVVAEVGARPDDDQIYRISWDGSVSDEPGFVAFGGQADQVSAALKEAFSDNMSLTEARGAALAALTAPPAATIEQKVSRKIRGGDVILLHDGGRGGGGAGWTRAADRAALRLHRRARVSARRADLQADLRGDQRNGAEQS